MMRCCATVLLLFLIAIAAVSNTDAACKSTYKVQSGDNLSNIAARNHVTLRALEAANPQISNPDKIYVGQTINIPPCSSGPAPSGSCASKYTVKSGDNLTNIAKRYQVTLSALEAANPQIKDFNKIQVGQVINIPPCGGSSSPKPTAPRPKPTKSVPKPTPKPAPSGGGVTITNAEFNGAITACGFKSQPDSKRVNMLASIKKLGGTSVVSTKRELAMYMAQIIHESAGLGIIKEIGGESASYAPYYGRGYIQLTGKSNYASASQALFGDDRLVQNPDLVTSEDSIAWGVTSYYWKTRVHTLSGVAKGQFGATTRGINGGECSANPERAAVRCKYYGKVLPKFGLSEKPDCSGC